MRRLRSWIGAALIGLLALPLSAQDDGAAPAMSGEDIVQSPVLIVEFDRLFSRSAFGARVADEIEAEGAAIASENRRIEADLTAEERRLTDQRADLEPDRFRDLAAAFDEKVQRLRREQDAKARALATRGDEAQRRFLEAAQPVLAEIMREAGAAVILEGRSVLLSADLIDITDLAIGRIDAEIGDGAGAAGTEAEDMPDAPGAEAAPETGDR